MKRLVFAITAALAFMGTAQANEELAKKNNCTACHKVEGKLVGPAYKEVAAKYKGDKKAEAMLIDPLHVEPVLDLLVQLDWAARLDEEGAQRFVLLCDPGTTPAAPLVDALLLQPSEATRAFRQAAGVAQLTLKQLL